MSSPARRSPSTSKSRSPSTSIPKAARSITAQEKAMLSNLNRGLALALAVAVLGGCATSKEKLLPHGDSTMMDIWQQNAGDGGGSAGQAARRQLLDARQSLRRPLTEADVQAAPAEQTRSEEHTSELQSLMRISYAVFCLKKKNIAIQTKTIHKRTLTYDE